ncbi:hypothetical protein BU26DRAFT_510786 [Trematosphaeria pertusa]|uniref:Uncharacterized protein n=1 Tax=Trematosphaeria pertusa TaxID=390896 RepID=A0A6A6HWU3_9PLEO|nr:uncharacterized protein BU26DRAFT_510786 [Trematosphaeria pertusa]KAF2242389.1 hypothetical protein BU26DRAFT_510786 [Trematosphaeria pertusa]
MQEDCASVSSQRRRHGGSASYDSTHQQCLKDDEQVLAAQRLAERDARKPQLRKRSRTAAVPGPYRRTACWAATVLRGAGGHTPRDWDEASRRGLLLAPSPLNEGLPACHWRTAPLPFEKNATLRHPGTNGMSRCPCSNLAPARCRGECAVAPL